MAELLQQAIAQIEKLPPAQQDVIAARFLAEWQDEQQWEPRFTATTNHQWEQMAAMVRQEIARGETVPLDTVFPLKHEIKCYFGLVGVRSHLLVLDWLT